MPYTTGNKTPRRLVASAAAKNPLAYIPSKYRLAVYAVLGLVALGVSAWQAADGDWLQAVSLFLGSLGFGTAASNVDTE